MKKQTRLQAFLLCLVMLVSISFPMIASAMDQVTIESDPDTATPRYFEYLNGAGDWVGLKTPRHYIVETGELAYCLQHKMSSPHSWVDFHSADLSSWYDTRTVTGLQIILEYGYPCNKPGNLSDDQARYATQNAVRFWLSENGDTQHWGFTNRLENPGNLRATAGNQHVLDWADELVGYARTQQPMQHVVRFTPSTLELNYHNGYFVGSTNVTLENCNGGYSLDQNSLPAGSVIEGYSGRSGDQITVKIPAAGNGNKTINLTANGSDNRTRANIFMYVTTDSSTQNLITISSSNYQTAGYGSVSLKTPAYGKVQVTKAGEDGEKPSGMVFGIYSDLACTNLIQRMTTGANGIAVSGDLLMGTYYVKELSASAPYILDGTVHAVQVNPAETSNMNLNNKKAKGQIVITKTNANPSMGEYPLTGAVFDIYHNNKIVDSVTVGADGRGTSKQLPINQTYIVKERTAPYGFVLDKNEYPVTLTYAGQTIPVVTKSVSIKEQPQVGRITITKNDAETGSTPQGDASLYGAKYRIENEKGQIVDRLTALGTRVVTSKELPLGTYRIYEEEPTPEGYLLNPDPIVVTLKYGGQNIEVVGASGVMQDTVKKGQISLVKFANRDLGGDSDPDPDIKPPLAGVEFEVRLKSSGKLYATMVTDADGKCTSPLLPYGIYIVTEKAGDANEGYLKVEPFEVFVSENAKTYSYILEDKAVEMKVRIVKIDSESGKHIPLEGFTFRLEDAKGNPVSFEILYPQPHMMSEFTTDASGSFYLPDVLPAGDYKLIEIASAAPYLLNNTPLQFTVSENGAVNRTITVDFHNEVAKGKIKIEKIGELLTGADTKETDYGIQYVPRYENRGLDGVVFEIFAMENIGTPDGTVYYRAGQKVDEIVTQNGSAISKELYLGKYIVREKAIDGDFVLDDSDHIAMIEYVDQITPIVIESLAIENQRQKGEIRIQKNAEYFNYDAGVFEMAAAEGFVFGVYSAANIKGIIPKDALVDIIVTDKVGRARTTADLPLSEYYIQELYAPDGYVVTDQKFAVDITSKNHTDPLFIDDQHEVNPIFNRMSKGNIELVKKDAEVPEQLLDGVVFELINENGKVITTFKTENGIGISSMVPYGQYVLREAKTKPGYILSSEEWPVEIGKDTETVQLELTNIQNEVKLKKTDALTGTAIAGTTILVESVDGAVSMLCLTDENGEISLRGIPAGKYIWKEKTPSNGYALNKELFGFEINEFGQITGSTEMKDYPTELKITKRDGYDDSLLDGAIFRLVDTNGEPVLLRQLEDGIYIPDAEGTAEVCTKDGYAIIRYLPAETDYQIEEVTGPVGYVKKTTVQEFRLSNEYSAEDPYHVMFYNLPTAIRINKTNQEGAPLTGAGFKIKDVHSEEALHFTKINDNWYKFDPAGTETEVFVDQEGTVLITGIPLSEYWLEESTVPKSYFPVVPLRFAIDENDTTDAPHEINIVNSPFVNLSSGVNKLHLLAAIIAGCAGIALPASLFLIWRRRHPKKDEGET